MQYGIRLAKEDIAFGEFCRLLAGLTADTPLGRAVAVRAEADAARIKAFGANERELRRKWRNFRREQVLRSERDWDAEIEKLKSELSVFSENTL